MSKRKNRKNNFSFTNGIKKLKNEFKQMIDAMPDDDFISMVAFLMKSSDAFEEKWPMDEGWTIDEEWPMDEGWEDDAEKFYNQENDDIDDFDLSDDEELPF